MPPSVASAPGSTEKKSPSRLKRSLSAMRCTPACTRTNKSSGRISRIEFMFVRSRLTPPKNGRTCPSSEVPAPNATTGIFCSLQYARTFETSCVLLAITTADGRTGGNADSSRPCWSSTDSFVDTWPETSVFRCAT
ncbi:unannotated protein [freshwater metagenome]|uniref:Unannotated protein n=1 Tax=freshwater metagenome TaxID=449393 RepID=A0A6J7VSZ7_9ZZZZ